ncbi:MAG: pyridoxamine 5'-phosphate oxidase [Actinomycetes bacterium]
MSDKLEREAIRELRRSYGDVGLAQFPADPFELFHAWLKDGLTNPLIVEANAMVLSTVDENQPVSRTVLLKDADNSFTFFTNYNSRKASEISKNEHVSLLFPWYAMERQVIVLGQASKVSAQVSNEYFQTRPWGSQIGAWSSEQSQDLESREALETRFKDFATKYPEGTTVPTPPHWGGYEVIPTSIEFWQGRYSRLHDRVRYTAHSNGWNVKRVNP